MIFSRSTHINDPPLVIKSSLTPCPNFWDHLSAYEQEFRMIEEFAIQDGIDIFEPWDYAFYERSLEKDKFSFDPEEMRPYLELGQVRRSIFDLIEKLYDVHFIPTNDYPIIEGDPSINAYEVTDAQGVIIGLMYEDLYLRDNKKNGAWMNAIRRHSQYNGERNLPICGINMVIPTVGDADPVLLSANELKTFYHEMGHALHGLLSTAIYPSQSGTNVARDFVELPSQLMEDWLGEIEYMQSFARHFETGEPIPTKLLEARQAAQSFGGGRFLDYQLTLSKIDMAFNATTTPITDIESTEKEIKTNFFQNPPSDLKCVWFPHPFVSEGYAAGYYSYFWSQCMDYDAFLEFKENGLYDKATATKFRENILEMGDSEDPMTLYVRFKGSQPDPNALLLRNGLSPVSSIEEETEKKLKPRNPR
jgi:peptidyl-dipeptidase Dcp